ncbi:WW domain-binding protein 2-like [Dermacentor silvarum]|uniref:WW domain-binding protein 2-like n=1 Tax=Dermacentor silvarum TaxID=543639 RepID=UPI0021014A89|nr:WW domain-binding protein 2-like [Dermacentor silvarum]
MSLNTAHAPGGVLIFKGEFILLYCDGVELTFEGPDAHQFHGTKKGRIYLTTHRMVFTNGNSKDFLQSFSFPFFTVSNLGLEQPIFGANYIKGTVKAEQNGNWTGKCAFKLKFMKGGAIEFGQAMMEAGKIASQHAAGMAPPHTSRLGSVLLPPSACRHARTGCRLRLQRTLQRVPDAPPGPNILALQEPSNPLTLPAILLFYPHPPAHSGSVSS